ncbi:MAG: ABC transporter permease [Cyclobacteriaceae bacterium]|nr:ABC transporter permease [Cyclobacteriaceae bacterium]
MIRKIINAFGLAFGNIRANLFHTVLSVLGIIIGVGALVSILSLIDGMEELARNQISQTTSLNGIMVQPEAYRNVNGVRIKKDSVPVISYPIFNEVNAALTRPVVAHLRSATAGEVTFAEKVIGANLLAVTSTLEPGVEVGIGNAFTEQDVVNQQPLVIVNAAFLKQTNLQPADALGQSLKVHSRWLKISGIVAGEAVKVPTLYFPITLLTEPELQAAPPDVIYQASITEDVPLIKATLTDWLAARFNTGAHSFKISTNEFRVEQVTKGFLLFRIIMGLIVGISVVVGGIGIMNVLLISVNERTAEIGVRKAVGANRRDITLLFLAESVTVSAFGSLVGLLFGIGTTMIIIPIVRALTEMPFQAAYTLNTILVITIVSLVVGVVFGTYPALRAARLNPVDAIRHE